MKDLQLEILEEFAHQAQAYGRPRSLRVAMAVNSRLIHYQKCRKAIEDLVIRIRRMKAYRRIVPAPVRASYHNECVKCKSRSPTHRCHA